MPMVGMLSSEVTAAETVLGRHSSTRAKQPASSSACRGPFNFETVLRQHTSFSSSKALHATTSGKGEEGL